MITFVTFHAESPPETVTKLAQNVTSFRRGYDYNSLCRLTLHSAKPHHADARLIVLTTKRRLLKAVPTSRFGVTRWTRRK